MGIKDASTAAERVTSKIGSKAVVTMSEEEFRNETMYQTTMHIVRKMLADGIISEEEYHQINAVFLKKYNPILGGLFARI